MAFAFNNPHETILKLDRMPNRTSDREYYLFNTQEYTQTGAGIRWVTNNGTLDMLRLTNLTTPLLFDLYHGNEQNLPNDVTYTIEQNELVDLVIQNTVATNGVCESHPFHLHGHKFWVHSHGTGLYNKLSTTPDTANPVLRDTMLVYASEYAHFTANRSATNHRKPCGWTKIRLIADNPGLWMFHCHIGAHSFMGMNILLKEDIKHLTMHYLSPY